MYSNNIHFLAASKAAVELENHDELVWHLKANLRELKLDAGEAIGYTFKALGAGFWALRQEDFEYAITAISLEAGDADTYASFSVIN